MKRSENERNKTISFADAAFKLEKRPTLFLVTLNLKGGIGLTSGPICAKAGQFDCFRFVGVENCLDSVKSWRERVRNWAKSGRIALMH